MTPKKKAFELLRKFSSLIGEKEQIMDNMNLSKLCALIAVNETIKETMLHDLTIYQHGRTAYWQEVKQEIEKL